MALFPFKFHGKDKSPAIDFNYPQEVSKNALSDLERALKSGDGELVVDALVRYSVAQSGISQEQMPDIINRIEGTIKRESRPEYKALLRYLEAEVLDAYRNRYGRPDRTNPEDEPLPDDFSEWDNDQFNHRICELITLALSEPEALKKVSTASLSKIIKGDELGYTLVPTLFEFLSLKGQKAAEGGVDPDLYSRIVADWDQATKGNVPAYLYAQTCHGGRDFMDLYHEYSNNEHSALVLLKAAWDKEFYQGLKEYASRFPQSPYTPEVTNKINELEAKQVYASYPEYATSHESITVKVDANNVNDLTLNVYRIPDTMIPADHSRYGGKELDISKLKLVHSRQVHIDGEIPFERSQQEEVTLNSLPYGMYVIVPSYQADGEQVWPESIGHYHMLSVTDIMTMGVCKRSQSTLIAVDATTGAPLRGVRLKGEGLNAMTTTDANGIVSIPGDFDSVDVLASRGEDHYGPKQTFYNPPYDEGTFPSVSAEVFTDLAIYRPGETIQWAAVLYNSGVGVREVVPSERVEVTFYDSNQEAIDTVRTSTDAFGRAQGTFTIPTDRMNSRFHIEVVHQRHHVAWHYINVSEYKTPTFAVTFPDARHSFVKGQPVKITGLAETYSGMPLANTEVKIQLRQNEWSWWWRWSTRDNGELLRDTVVTTDASGRFTVEWPADAFEENLNAHYRWAYYNYTLQASVTDAAGETQEASHAFIIGERSGIEFAQEAITHRNDGPVTLPIKYNTTSETVTSVTCKMMLYNLKGDIVAYTSFETDNPVVNLTGVPSGQYKLVATVFDSDEEEASGNKASCEITLYRTSDSMAPVKNTTLWVPADGKSVDERNVAHITIGTSAPEAHIYFVARSSDRVLGEGWLRYAPGIHDLPIEIPKGRDEFIVVELMSAHEKESHHETVRIAAPAFAEQLRVKVTTFRDRLVPGEREHWTLQLVDQNGKPRHGGLMLAMTDKAINTLADNTWQFKVPLQWQTLYHISSMTLEGTNMVHNRWQRKELKENGYQIPELYLYDQELFGLLSRPEVYYSSNIRVRGAASIYGSKRMDVSRVLEGRAAGVVVEECAEMEMADSYGMAADEGVAPADNAAAAQLDNITLRESDIKTALWMPMLTSDVEGNVQIEFDAPQFNTTWLLQAIGLDKDLYTDHITREVVTQKPVMVRANAPRFLRHGDVATLAARVQNATDQATKATAVIELFDPRTGDVYTTHTTAVTLDARGTQPVTIDWTVPADIPFVGLRVKAATDAFGDGEQVMIPVLEAASPVIETQPFYVEAGEKQFSTTLPQTAQDARLTLEYCDNPVWYCVTALPTIFSDNYAVATRLAHSLFAIDVAQGIAQKQPQIGEAITYWKAHAADSTLTSMLAKNQDLKIGTLLASPWVREADRQTLRMSRLDELFNTSLMAKERGKILEALGKMQHSDGGWPWFDYPGCRSSLWTTQEVLELIGEIRHMGYLPANADLDRMIEQAVKYLDNEYLRIYREQKDKKDYSGFTSYAYVRSLFNHIALKGDSRKLFDNTLKQMSKDWGKGLSLGEKSFFAMTLNRNGYQSVAHDIMESVRQFALTKPELGMYWDNLQVGWRYFDKVAVTANILRALHECDPRPDEIDQVRKWMLLMKQTNDWGSSSLAAEAVESLLTTGTPWLERNPLPVVTVGDEQLPLDKMDEYLGYFRKTITAAPGAPIRIERTGNGPAWGAVYAQFTAPMTSIPEVAITELSVSKEFYRYANDGTLQRAETFQVGDKVQVRLVIKNNRDLDYVTVKDERAGCFEPVDQVSGCRAADHSWYYLETKDALTNIFFSDLQKGTHVITYDVHVMAQGRFSAGIATAQCQYAPQITAHSAGRQIEVNAK
ncbi:MAG: hypothetical protein IKR25_08580 [Muribaculaceae bacterium]|nr:hypothetical protein [Muribaculaceae bacterium]